MAFQLTNNTKRALQELSIEPNIVVKVEGLDTLISAKPVQEYITIGCPGFFVGAEGYFIGGLKDIDPELNKTLIDSKSTSYSIKQQINYDEGKSSSIASMNVGLVDKDAWASELISPGFLVEDIMGRKVEVFVTFGQVSFFEDSIRIFKGFVTLAESGPGAVKLKLNHPDNKKKVELWKSADTGLALGINSSITSIQVDDASSYFLPQGPFKSYIRINSEVIEYAGITGNTFTGCVRGSLGTSASAHNANDKVSALYSIEGNPLDLALQLMMSGHGTDPIYEDIEVSSFVQIGSGATYIDNAIYFDQINVPRDYGLRIGDTVTITGATNGANNFVQRTVVDVVQSKSGYYIVVDGAALVLENVTSAVMSTYTQFNTMTEGMKMRPDDVDINQHLLIKDFFHPSVQMIIYLKEDDIDGKEFINEQLYQPIACFELPRQAQSSVGYTVGPIPGQDIVTVNAQNITDPKNTRVTRTTAKSYFNEVVYKFDDTPIFEEAFFTRGKVIIAQDSKNRIPGNNRTYTVESLGLRSSLNAENIIDLNSQRWIDRYKFAAETVKTSMLLRDGAGVEVGDIVVGDFGGIQLTDSTKGNRLFKARLYEIQNRSLNLKTGRIDLSLLDTGLNLDTRFGLISPCNPIAGVISQSEFVIGQDPLYPSQYGDDVYRDWEPAFQISQPMSVIIHNADWSIQEDLIVKNISENTFTLDTPASITLTPGLIVEFTIYEDTDTSDRQKLLYAYMNDNPTFLDGENQYSMI